MFAGLNQAAYAATRADLYQVTVPLSDHSETGQAVAFQSAMKIVLVRVTGRRSAEEDPALAPLLSSARRYVQQYRSAPDNEIWVAFDGPAIVRWLTQNGQPLWGHERPTTVVLLAVGGGQSGTLITGDDTSELKAAIDAAAAARGLPLVWPSAADVQKNALDYATVTGAPATKLADIGRRMGGDATLIGRASNNTAAAQVHWTHLFQDHSNEYFGALDGVNRTADLYAGLFAASGTLAPVDIEVSGIAGVREYAAVQGYLESLTFIAHVSVLGLDADTVSFRLTTRGSAEQLQRALSLNGRLQPLSAGTNGIQRFQLRR